MTEKKDYEVGYKKPPVATRFKKGKCPNPLGRGGKKKTQEFDPGRILQSIDNEAIMVNIEGERKRMLKADWALANEDKPCGESRRDPCFARLPRRKSQLGGSDLRCRDGKLTYVRSITWR